MSYKIIVLLLLSSVLLTNCSRNPDNKDAAITKEDLLAIDTIYSLSAEEGSRLLKTNCYSCHNPASASHDVIIAPPLVGAKAVYKSLYAERTKFIARMGDFIEKPTKGNAAMKGPVWRFGVMPPIALDKKKIREIVAFIYDNQIEAPSWFPAHYEEENGRKWVQ